MSVFVLKHLVDYIVNGETHGLTEAEIDAVDHFDALCLPDDFDGDTEFGRCDITSEYGDLVELIII